MNILYHHRTQSEDAQGVHIEEMIEAFQNLGHQVAMVAMAEPREKKRRDIIARMLGWVAHRVPAWAYELMGLAYNLYGYYRICRAIEATKPGFIYERYALNTACGVWASRRYGIPLVLEVNAPLFHEQFKLGRLCFTRLAKFSERWICSHSTWTIVVSQVMKDMLVRDGVPSDKLLVMPNGIDPARFRADLSGERVRSQYGLRDKLVVGFVGWFRPWHGLEMLLEIMKETDLAKLDAHLLLVGDGPAYSTLRQYATTHNLLSVVTFTGPARHEDIPEHLAAMDIAVQPSATEYACPMKLLEYLGMGKCVVAPDQPNIREIVEPGKTAFLFQPGSKQDLAATLVKVALDKEARMRVSRQGLQCIRDRGLLWETNAAKVLSLLFASHTTSRVGMRRPESLCNAPSIASR
jgi:glycosyltransferase involved in cell wall biosynthesis